MINTNKCEGKIIDNKKGEYTIKVQTDKDINGRTLFWAANPPTYSSSFTGSGMPFLI